MSVMDSASRRALLIVLTLLCLQILSSICKGRFGLTLGPQKAASLPRFRGGPLKLEPVSPGRKLTAPSHAALAGSQFFIISQADRYIRVVETGPQVQACNVSRSYFLGSVEGVGCDGVPLFTALSVNCVERGRYETTLPSRCGTYNVTIKLALRNVRLDLANYFEVAQAQWSTLVRLPVVWTKSGISVPEASIQNATEPEAANGTAGIWYKPKEVRNQWCLNCQTAELDGMGDYQYIPSPSNERLPSRIGTPTAVRTASISKNVSISKHYRSPQAIQSCIAEKGIQRIAFVGGSTQRFRMYWWWWLLDTSVDITQFGWTHNDTHVRAANVSISWFFDPLGLRLMRYLLSTTGMPCTTKGCDSDAIYDGIKPIEGREKAGAARLPMDLDGFDVIVIGYGLWLSTVTPATLAGHDARMAELARQLKLFKSMHPHSHEFIWVDAFSEVPDHAAGTQIYQDPVLLGMLRDVAHRHLAGAPTSIVDAYAISLGREMSSPDKRHYGEWKHQENQARYLSYVGSVERETTERIVKHICA